MNENNVKKIEQDVMNDVDEIIRNIHPDPYLVRDPVRNPTKDPMMKTKKLIITLWIMKKITINQIKNLMGDEKNQNLI